MTDSGGPPQKNKDAIIREIDAIKQQIDNREAIQLRLMVEHSKHIEPSLELDNQLQIIDDAIKALKQALAAKQQELDQLESQPALPQPALVMNHLPFTNRDDELREITSSTAPAYYLLDAPAGYGKTELLKRLQLRFTEANWRCIYVATRANSNFLDLINAVASAFEIELDSEGDDSFVVQLGGRLRQQWEGPAETARKEGLVLLIDLDKMPSRSMLNDVLETLLPDIEQILRTLTIFSTKHNRFRAIIAGRYLASFPRSRAGVQPKVLHLSPFKYDVIRNSVGKYLPEQEESTIALLSAHLFYLTGGHPHCMAHILEEYRRIGLAPNHLLQNPTNGARWKTTIHTTIDDIRRNIVNSPLDLCSVLDNMSIFRFLDIDILKSLNEHLIGEKLSAYGLADALTGTYLLTRHRRLLRDDITRRLLAIRLRQEHEIDFVARCEQAKCVCAERLRKSGAAPVELRSDSNSEMWAIEYMFQALQRNAPYVQDQDARTQLHLSFFAQTVPEALRLYVAAYTEQSEEWFQEEQVLSQAMEDDWEFQFTVNYYLRGSTFTDGPYVQLQQNIASFFDGAPAAGGRHA